MKKLICIALALLMICSLAACGGSKPAPSSASDVTPAAPAARTFTMGIDAEYPPFSYMDDSGAYTGFDVEICQAACEKLGWTFAVFGVNWDNKLVQLTCTSSGTRARTCVRCGAAETESIPAKGHTESAWKVTKEATCTVSGTRIKTCTVCGVTLKSETVAALGHSYGAWKVTKEATCTASGTRTRTCARCGAAETESIPAKGHTESAWKVTKEATCTASGTRIKTCTVCGVTLKSETVAALGHSYGAWTTVTSATCTDSGSEKRTCSRCGASETRTVAALGHDIVWTTLSEATCETAGARKGECSRCGKAFKEEIPALGHDYHLNDPPSDIDPCLDLYMASQTCSRCGDTQELYSVGPPGHTWQQYESTAGPMANNRRLDGYSSYYYCSRCRGYALSDDGAPHPYDTPHGYYPS